MKLLNLPGQGSGRTVEASDMMRVWLWWLWLTGLVWAVPPPARVHPSIRCSRDSRGQLQSLDTVILELRHPQSNLQVDLVASVHVGESRYYQQLNRLFQSYDAILYELIADSSAGRPLPSPSSPGGQDSPLSAAQQGLAELLDLKIQLDQIDYTPGRFVHADISPGQLQAAQLSAPPSLPAMLRRGLSLSRSSHPEVRKEFDRVDLFKVVLQGPDARERFHLRRAIALMLCDPKTSSGWLSGSSSQALLHTRNQRVLEVLRQRIKQPGRRLAVFFGAAHLPELEQQLVRQLGLRYHGQRWLSAWSLQAPRRP